MPKKKSRQPALVSFLLPFVILSFATTFATFIITLNITTFLDRQKVLGIQTTQAQEVPPDYSKEKQYWQEVILKTPTYRDAYVELAQIAIDEGNPKDAEGYLNKAKKIDPNSPVVIELLQKLVQ